jgi:hypothetical protein
MKTFKVNEFTEIRCNSVNTRHGFRHDAKLYVNNELHTKAKACYYNRTWESFEYESVIINLLNKAKIMPEEQKSVFLDRCRKNELDEINANFGFIAGIAKLGNLLCENQTDKNDWKKRMLKAGLPGLDIPEDWNTLNENEKEKRLDFVINELSK